MRILLDTHVFVWTVSEPERLSATARRVIEDARNELLLSIASVWEMAIKSGTGKLTLPHPAIAFVQRQLVLHSITLLPIKLSHLERLEKLPPHHCDPFDRLLVAQCMDEDATLITVDSQLQLYPLKMMS